MSPAYRQAHLAMGVKVLCTVAFYLHERAKDAQQQIPILKK